MSTEFPRIHLLEQMASLQSTSGSDSHRFFVPPSNAKRLLSPDAALIIGARGSGKSALARFLIAGTEHIGGPRSVPFARLIKEYQGPSGFYIDAFSQQGTTHPSAINLDPLVRTETDEGVRAFWMNWLFVHLGEQTARFLSSSESAASVTKATQSQRSNIQGTFVMDAKSQRDWLAAMDTLHAALVLESRTLFIDNNLIYTFVYDDLDTVGADNPAVRARFIGGLISLWTALLPRYKYFRVKIFLPSDLFDTRQLDSIDVSKLLARSERLEWSHQHLYRLVLRHLGQDDRTRVWLETLGVRFEALGDDLGWMPELPSDETLERWLSVTFRSVIAIAGTRERAPRWILNRLRDGQGRIAPRTMLDFFRLSAVRALEHTDVPHRNHLIAPQDAMDALKPLGGLRVAEIRPVYPWVDRMDNLRGKVVPLPRKEIERLLETDGPDAPRPTPDRDGRSVLNELIRLGLLRDVGVEDLFDVPMLFGDYFGIRRDASAPMPPPRTPM